MSKKHCCTTEGTGTRVEVSVDVTRIVKYACVSGVLIVGIIFAAKAFIKKIQLEQH